MVGGSILYVGCLFAQAEAKQDQYYKIFLSQALGQGLAQGMIYLPSVMVMSHYFRKRRAFAMGLAVSGSSTGGIVFPIMLNNLIAKNGYPWAVRACGFFVLGATVIANLLMRPRYVPHHTTRTLPNLLADKIGIYPVFLPTSVVAGAVIFVMFGISTIPAVVIFCLLYGLFSGAYISLLGPMFVAMADHPSEIGARTGFALALIGIAALVGTPIDGALVGNGPDYVWSNAIIFSAIVMLVGCAFGLVAGKLLAKKRGKRWV